MITDNTILSLWFRVSSNSYNANVITNPSFSIQSVFTANMKKKISPYINLYNSAVKEPSLYVWECPVRYSFTIYKCVVYNIARFKWMFACVRVDIVPCVVLCNQPTVSSYRCFTAVDIRDTQQVKKYSITLIHPRNFKFRAWPDRLLQNHFRTELWNA